MRSIRFIIPLIAFALAACSGATDPLLPKGDPSDSVIVPPSDSTPFSTQGWQLVSVNGAPISSDISLYSWTYKFRALASDSVDTRYTVHYGIACTFADGSWAWLREVTALWDTWNPNYDFVPPGGSMLAQGSSYALPPFQYPIGSRRFIGIELRYNQNGPQTFGLSMIARRSGSSLIIDIAAENNARYIFTNAGAQGAANCQQ